MNDFDEILNKLKDIIDINSLFKVIISNPIKKGNDIAFKVIISKVLIKQKECFQFSYFIDKKVTHENIFDYNIVIKKILEVMVSNFKQCDISSNKNITILMNKRKLFKIVRLDENNNIQRQTKISHDNQKNYILRDGMFIEWMFKLDMMSKEGKILNHMQRKFRQINKFLEMVDDIEKYLPDNAVIVDMGCGKSYLTFAMYYYFNTIKKKNITIKGFDLKKDVVEKCNKLAKEFNFNNLCFFADDIATIDDSNEKINMIITLHACDTATDYAMYHAVKWKCDVIMSVPCCQHELFQQVENTLLEPMLEYGILKERFSSLLTDTIRANTLELCGYKTNVIEFIDMEHTPKNIMIRAVKRKNYKKDIEKFNKYMDIIKQFNIQPIIYKLLKDKM